MKKLTGNEDWYRNDTEMVSNFFVEVCVIGLSKRNSTFPSNLYSFCNMSKKKSFFIHFTPINCLIILTFLPKQALLEINLIYFVVRGKEKGISVASCFKAGADVAFAEMNVNMIHKPGNSIII